MILNHKEAIEYITENSLIDMFSVGQVHSKLMSGLIPYKSCGLIRSGRVNITGTKYIPPKNREIIINAMDKVIETVNAIKHPVEKAMYLMTAVPYIQPYEDGNKRTGRLLMNMALIKEGFPPFSFKNVDKLSYIKGIIGFYEFGDRTNVSQMFRNAYKGAGEEYISRYTYEENPDAIIYRDLIRKVIHENLKNGLDIDDGISKYGVPISLKDHIKNEASQVHEGNCSLYKLESMFLPDLKQDSGYKFK